MSPKVKHVHREAMGIGICSKHIPSIAGAEEQHMTRAMAMASRRTTVEERMATLPISYVDLYCV
jgi:hypothetical protein